MKHKESVSILALTAPVWLGFLLTSCGGPHRGTGTGEQARILSISPAAGDVSGGDSVTIRTADFFDDFLVDLPQVWFGTNPAAGVAAASSHTIKAITPRVTTAGPVDVVVDGTGLGSSAILVDGFVFTGVMQFPVITAVIPGQGPVGTVVEIQGQNFSPSPGGNLVRFNGVIAPVLSESTTTLNAVVPPRATSGPLNVEVAGDLSNDVVFMVTSPWITDLSVRFGDYGDPVTILGENFSPIPSENEVRFNGALAAVLASTTTTIDTSVPFNSTRGPVTVRVAGETSNEAWFCVSTTSTPPPPPTMIFLTPTSGPAGSTFLITGTDFSTTPSNNFVMMNNVMAMVLSATWNDLTVEVPPSATTGPVTVTVEGRDATSSLLFTVTSAPPLPPTLTSLQPAIGPAMDAVRIQGTGFDPDFRNHRVEFNGVPAEVAAGDTISLLVTVPFSTSGPVTVDLGGQTSNSLPFAYVGSPPGAGTVDLMGQTLPIPGDRVTYLIDISGSMGSGTLNWTDRFGNPVTGTRLEFVQDRVIASFQALPDTARFNVFNFACNRNSWMPQTEFATAANKVDAEAWVMGLAAWGGTGTGPAISAALQERENLTLLIITDGQPNCGASGTAGHVCLAMSGNTQGATFHTFGIEAFGTFQQFLEDLAAATGGTFTAVVP